jgi:tight adherence protein B
MNIFIVGIVIFIMSVLILQMCLHAYKTMRYPERGRIRKGLKEASSSEYMNQAPGILKNKVLSEVPALNRILAHITGINRLETLVIQANTKYAPGSFVLLAIILALLTFLPGLLVSSNYLVSAVAGAFSASIPFFYLLAKKKKRMDKFMRQLPDGLDLVARALKAGHAFASGMKMVADEFDDPLGPEFRRSLEEINFGASVHDALKSLAYRIDCPDLKYFVASVILQRETGGNLAEIIESIAHLIRERFKLYGKIRTLSAEGRLSAIILIALPFLSVVAMQFLNPEYINTLFSEPAGRTAVVIAAFMLLIGIFIMRRMIKIKV